MLAGVDRAAFVTALVHRLRRRGVAVGMTSAAAFVEALAVAPPMTESELYWLARVTLVSRHHDLQAFDEVFRAAFGSAVQGLGAHTRRSGPDLDLSGRDALDAVAGERDEKIGR